MQIPNPIQARLVANFCSLLLLLSCGLEVMGQCGGFSLFQPAMFPLAGYDAAALRVADVNNDGVPDLITVLKNDGKISVQLGNGDGGLTSTTEFPAGTTPSDLELADFDRDGELDVVVANKAANQISVLAGDGNGGFAVRTTITTGYEPDALETGFFDNDNFIDLVVGLNGSLRTYRGAENFSFTEVANIATAMDAYGLKGGDLNNDGKKDLVLSGLSEIRVLLGQGLNTFQPTATILENQVTGIGVMDFDANGTLDLVISETSTPSLRSYKGTGDGTFLAPIATPYASINDIESFDYDGDGHLDVVTPVSILKGNSTGAFTLFTNIGVHYAFSSSVEIADFNGDALPDFLTVIGRTSPNDTTSVVLNTNGGPILERTLLVGAFRAHDIDSADFNLDGRSDAVIADQGRNRLLVFLQNASGEMILTPASGLSMSGGFNVSPYSVHVADINGDSKPDIIAPDSFARKVNVFTGNGAGAFVRTVIDIPTNTSTPTFVRTGDFNGDGHLDIISMSDPSRNFYILLNNGMGGFSVITPPVFIGGSQSGPPRVAIGRFTSDNTQDLVTSRFFDPSMLFLSGAGDGTFGASPSTIPASQFVTSMLSGDYDNDGFRDIAFTSGESVGTLKISYGLGNATFPATLTFNLAGSAHDLEYGDFDLDGIPDFIVASASVNSIVFFKGRGGRVFDNGITRYVGSFPFAMTSRDFNGDGKLDLAFGNRVTGLGFVVPNTTNSLPCVSVGNAASVAEGNAGTVSTTFDVSLSAPSSQPVSINYKTVNRTAAAGPDYVATNGTLIFPAGTTSQSVTVTVYGDTLDEADETVVLSLSQPSGVRIIDATGTATILDDDAPPQLTIGNVALAEGDNGTQQAQITIGLSAASGRKVKLRVASLNISAIAGEDYQTIGENVFFNAGEITKQVRASVLGDFRVEPDESFSISASNLAHVDPPVGSGIVTILNDDVGGNVQFSSSVFNVWESSGSAAITITRANGSASHIVVQYATSDGTATAGQDYTSVLGSVTFGPNETTKTFNVPILNDSTNEPNVETVNLSLTSISGGATPGNPIVATLNIEDDDASRGSQFDFDGDAKTDLSIFRPGPGEWWYSRSSDGGNRAFQFGSGSDKLVPADYTGDGKTDVAFFRPSTGQWFVLRSEDSSFFAFPFGNSTDVPAPADYDGDGKADAAVFRESNLTWYISKSSGGTDIIGFGAAGDKPVPADYDGDGRADIAIYRLNAVGGGQWWIQRSSNVTVFATQFGASTDKTVQGDYTGDGKADIAFWRPSTGFWNVLRSEDFSFYAFPFGTTGDVPVPGDYDGDGKFDAGVFRPSNSTWFAQRSTAGTLIQQFGITGDLPLPNAFVR